MPPLVIIIRRQKIKSDWSELLRLGVVVVFVLSVTEDAMQLLLMLSLMIDLCSLVDHPIEKEVPILLIGIMPTGKTEGAGVWIL